MGWETEELIDAGNAVVTRVSFHSRGAGSGAETVERSAEVYWVEDGAIVRYRRCQSRDEALNLVTVRAVYEAANRRDLDALFAMCHQDAEWESDPRVPNAGIFRGRAEIERFMEDQDAPFEASVAELERLIPAGDQVLALVRMRWRPRGSTSEIDIRIAHLWTLRGGKAARCQAFAEREKGFQAAGLPATAH